jgi:MarR family transcriptional regulator, lower aerobic nicotinate degradation pathway regulator
MPGTPHRTPERLAQLPSRLLATTALHADRLVTAGLTAVDAHKWDYAVLVTLQEYGPASQAELSDWSGIHRSDMVAVLNTLADAGHIARTPDPADRRRNIITLTPSGRRRLTRLDRTVSTIQSRVLAPLTPQERTELTRLLSRLAAHHGDAM